MKRTFKDIKEIYETSDLREVNWFLSKGWELLEIYQKLSGNIQVNQTLPLYILGKPENIKNTAHKLKKDMEEEAKKMFQSYYKADA